MYHWSFLETDIGIPHSYDYKPKLRFICGMNFDYYGSGKKMK